VADLQGVPGDGEEDEQCGDEGDEQQLFSDECQECGAEFRVPEASTSLVECPDCGASGARTVAS
jgi:predicted RNA-binding Zn-ribbon protein involved in translation (DUF1610 family)